MGASAAINLKYVGNGPSGGSQTISDITGGPKAKTLYGYGTLVSGSDATTAPVNFIDGVQKLGKPLLLSLQSVEAPATYQGVANIAWYHSVQADSQFAVGDKPIIAGFTNSGNNLAAGSEVAISFVRADAIGIVNASSVAETNPAATASLNKGGVPVWVEVFPSGIAGSSTADALFVLGTNHFQASLVTNTGFVLNYPTVTTSGVTINFGAVIAFSS